MTTGGWKGGWGSAQASKDGWERTRRRAPSRLERVVRVLVVIAILALCPFAWNAVESIGFHAYQNTAPPLSVQTGGVILRVSHSRYLILDTIVVTLTNDSNAPIYLPNFLSIDCRESLTQYQDAQGWQPNSMAC